MRAKCREIVRRCSSERPTQILRSAFEIAAISGQSVPRSAGLGCHHIEETVDECLVLGGHVRGLVPGVTFVTGPRRRSSEP